jgi:hypothetical protein
MRARESSWSTGVPCRRPATSEASRVHAWITLDRGDPERRPQGQPRANGPTNERKNGAESVAPVLPSRAQARCRVEAHAIARAIRRQLAQSRVAAAPGAAS